MSTVLEVLRAARERVARGWTRKAFARNAEGDGSGWCQIVKARNAAGEARTWSDDDAVSFCVLGALFIECQDTSLRRPALDLLAEGMVGDWPNFYAWNDAPERTQGDVIALYDAAIAKAEAEQ